MCVVAISEPYRVLDDPRWFQSAESPPRSAIYATELTSECRQILKGNRYVAIKHGTIICSVYFSPRWSIEKFLYNILQLEVAFQNEKVLVIGDFNARSRLWDTGTPNQRGDILIEFATYLDLDILNKR